MFYCFTVGHTDIKNMNGVPGSSSTTGTSVSLGGYNKGNNHNGRHNGQYQVNGINGSGNGAGGGGGAGNGSGVIHNGQYRPRVNGLNGLNGNGKEIQIVYRLYQENCYLLHVPGLPLQPASIGRG